MSDFIEYKYKTNDNCLFDVCQALNWLKSTGHKPSFSDIEITAIEGGFLYTLSSEQTRQILSLNKQITKGNISHKNVSLSMIEILGSTVKLIKEVRWTFICDLDCHTLTELL